MDLTTLEIILEIKFNDKQLLRQALTHRSYLNESLNKKITSNERLEFLGDAILSLIVSNFLYQKFDRLPEGDLTNFRASLVKTQTLARISQKLNLGEYLLLSRGEEEEGGRNNQGILADAFEAIIGAIFIDSGLAVTTNFVTCHLIPILPKIIKNKEFRDFKSLLQEKIQAEKKASPTYKVLKETGPDHHRVFMVGAFSDGKKLGTGSGHSKQEAEQEAARRTLEILVHIK